MLTWGSGEHDMLCLTFIAKKTFNLTANEKTRAQHPPEISHEHTAQVTDKA